MLKTAEEIAIVKKGGAILKQTLAYVLPLVKPGVTTDYLDKKAEEFIHSQGAIPGFKKVPHYHWTICACVNEQVVHTPPSAYVLKEGDIITVDAGVFYKGYHTDAARTVAVGNVSAQVAAFLKTGEQTLKRALSVIKPGKRIGHISEVIQHDIQSSGYYVIRELTGHGVGENLHEDPLIPGFLDRPVEKTVIIKPGMVLAVEVIYSKGSDQVVAQSGSNWSLITSDRSISACFEDTIAVEDDTASILT